MKQGDKILVDGKEQTVYLCNKKAPCRKSKYCGKQCIYIADAKYEQKYIQLTFLKGWLN